MPTARSTNKPRLRGSATVEFALTALAFFTLVFGMVEVARAMYLWSTLAVATRSAARAAAVADFSSAAQMDAVRQRALLRDSPGRLMLGGSIDDQYLAVDYLDAALAPVAPAPPCPGQNIVNCANGPSASCIRYVRVRLCMPGTGGAGSCTHVPYEPLVGLEGLFAPGGVLLPDFQTIVPAGSLGYKPGASASCS